MHYGITIVSSVWEGKMLGGKREKNEEIYLGRQAKEGLSQKVTLNKKTKGYERVISAGCWMSVRRQREGWKPRPHQSVRLDDLDEDLRARQSGGSQEAAIEIEIGALAQWRRLLGPQQHAPAQTEEEREAPRAPNKGAVRKCSPAGSTPRMHGECRERKRE